MSDDAWISRMGSASRAKDARIAALEAENARMYQDRYDALSVYTTDGMLASEWIARTGAAERESRAAWRAAWGAEYRVQEIAKALAEAQQKMEGFAEVVDAAAREWENIANGRRGMQVPFHGDFGNVAQPSAQSRLKWWARSFRAFLTADAATSRKENDR